jgi:3',5'-cyclic AMP phosphodiesterase CpdA
MFTIAQITDLHVTTSVDPLNQTRNADRLRQTLASIAAMRPLPVAIIATGDLVDRGTIEEYAALKAILTELDMPIYLGVGNHDHRLSALSQFSAPTIEADPNGFVQYAIEFEEYRIVICDTLDEGRETGQFCEHRAAWLHQALLDRPNIPTLIALHHPPIPSGIKWMDPDPSAQWIVCLDQILRRHSQVRAITSGHLHRAYVGRFANSLVTVSPATSIQLTLDLTDVDMWVPDGREILTEEPPGFMIHMFDAGEITSHFCLAGPWPSAVNYMHPFVKP